jgi:hypothetical protein
MLRKMLPFGVHNDYWRSSCTVPASLHYNSPCESCCIGVTDGSKSPVLDGETIWCLVHHSVTWWSLTTTVRDNGVHSQPFFQLLHAPHLMLLAVNPDVLLQVSDCQVDEVTHLYNACTEFKLTTFRSCSYVWHVIFFYRFDLVWCCVVACCFWSSEWQ